ncbi:MAG: rRNA maturation RNase YbeY [Bacteroidales bacterium]
MEILFFNEDIDFKLPYQQLISQWIAETINSENYIPGQINIIFTSDKYLLSINKQYLSHNYFTDIITFNYCQDQTIHGDIFISIETVENNSIRFGVTFKKELFRVIIHGILHLIGYDDQADDDKVVMRKKENEYLDRLKNLF